MSGLAQFIPLAFFLVLHAVYIRLAARVLRASQIIWAHAFLFAALVVALTGAIRLGIAYVGGLPALVSTLFGLVLQLALGAWFFRERALASNGQPLGWKGGVKLTALSTAFLFVTLAMLFWGMRMMLPAAP